MKTFVALICTILSDFDLSNLEKKLQWQVQLILPLMCSFNFEIGCQDRLRVNSDADEALAELDIRIFTFQWSFAQNLSSLTLSPNPLKSSDTLEVTGVINPEYAPFWFLQFLIDEELVGLISGNNLLFSQAIRSRYRPEITTSSLLIGPNVSFTLRLAGIDFTDNGRVLRIGVMGFENKNFTFVLNVLPDCPIPETSFPLLVEANSTLPDAVGNFTCAGTGGVLFDDEGRLLNSSSTFCTRSGIWSGINSTRCWYQCPVPETSFPLLVEASSTLPGAVGNFTCAGTGGVLFDDEDRLLNSSSTFCTRSGIWSGINSTRCWYPPSVTLRVLTLVAGGSTTLSLTCNSIPPSREYIFYIGGVGYLQNVDSFFLPSFNDAFYGTSVSCQAVTPYTRALNATGRSESVPFIRFEEPNQMQITCSWRLGQSEKCNVTFFARPAVEYLVLSKNGSRAFNNGSNTLLTSGRRHEYLFQKSKVSLEDYGQYRLVVRYVKFPGLRYVVFFDIVQAQLPNVTSDSCVWFSGQQGVCSIGIEADGATAILLERNGEVIANESSLTISNGRFDYTVSRVSDNYEGSYSLTIRLPSTETKVFTFEIFVRDYPFNSAAVIGISLAVLVLIVIAFIWLACSMRTKNKQNGDVELLQKRRNMNSTTRATANRASGPSGLMSPRSPNPAL